MKSSDLHKATEILFDLVSNLEPRLRPLQSWFFQTVETIDKWSQSEGNQGIKRAKDALGQGWLAVLGEPTQQLDFVKTQSGIPSLVKPLVDRVNALRKDARLMSATLSLVRITDLWEGRKQDSTIEDSLSVIVDSRVPSTARKIIDEFDQFVALFLQSHPDHPLAVAWNKPLKLGDPSKQRVTFYSESAGPNGPLTASAHLDMTTLSRSICSDGETLLEHVNRLGDEICARTKMSWKLPRDFLDALADEGFLESAKAAQFPGKLSTVSDKSGKLRVIAMPDWYTQFMLRPIHSYLMDVLRNVPEDATFDQRSAIPKICKWEDEGAYLASFDQTACTDLFPFNLQISLLTHLQGAPLAESVRTVMSDRDWEIKLPSGKTRVVRWKVGQPLGAYASWPLMALTHHFLVQYAHWRSYGRKPNWVPFRDYVICGDDIVIADRRVANSYRKVATLLGMKINLSKSHISGRGTSVDPVAEFTKVVVWRGQPLFPIRPKMVYQSVRDWRHAVPLFIDLATREGFAARLNFLTRVIMKHYTARRKFLMPLLTIPREFGGVGYRDAEPLKRRFESLDTGEIHPWLYYLCARIRNSLKRSVGEISAMQQPPSRAMRYHPLTEALQDWPREEKYCLLYDHVPSIEEIANVILVDGLRMFEHQLPNSQSRPHAPWEARDLEREDLKNRTAWEYALRKKHYFSDLGKSITPTLRVKSDSSPLFESVDIPANLDDPLAASQYSTIVNYLERRVSSN